MSIIEMRGFSSTKRWMVRGRRRRAVPDDKAVPVMRALSGIYLPFGLGRIHLGYDSAGTEV
jgi:hypothetical protein